MRTRRSWSGVFHCAICKIEEELRDDDSVECHECGELMSPGALYTEEEEEAEDTSEGEEEG